MGKIISAFFIFVIATAFSYAAYRINTWAALGFAAASLAAFFGALYLFLLGLREFLLTDIIAELRKISQNTASK